ncbi:MAG: hypothetical protein FWG04_04660 [Desulfovibrionaceae bacterium]|nr:hypothetical protein [Desulfovibrionaceae bacterium]
MSEHAAATAGETAAYGEVDLWNGNAAGDQAQEPEQRPVEEQAAPMTEKAAAEAAGGPAAFTDFTLPQGAVVDAALMQEFKELAGDMNLNQEQAQQLIDLQGKVSKAQGEHFAHMRREWLEAIYTDAEFGGNNIGRTEGEVRLAMQEHDPSGALEKLLISQGFHDHPEVLRFLARVGRRRRVEGKVLTSRVPAVEEEAPLAKRLWPYMK